MTKDFTNLKKQFYNFSEYLENIASILHCSVFTISFISTNIIRNIWKFDNEMNALLKRELQ